MRAASDLIDSCSLCIFEPMKTEKALAIRVPPRELAHRDTSKTLKYICKYRNLRTFRGQPATQLVQLFEIAILDPELSTGQALADIDFETENAREVGF